MDTSITTLSDAILLAERMQYADDFVKHGYDTGSMKHKDDEYGTPMDIDMVHSNGRGRGGRHQGRGRYHDRGGQPQRGGHYNRGGRNG